MTAPSNANTSGLEVVAHRMRQLHHEIDGPITGWMYCPPSQHPSGNARWEVEPLVTAASAQDRIAELERWQAAAIRSARIHDENIREFDARATAAEARADRLAKALEDISSGYANCDDFQDAQDIARAALQQETQP